MRVRINQRAAWFGVIVAILFLTWLFTLTSSIDKNAAESTFNDRVKTDKEVAPDAYQMQGQPPPGAGWEGGRNFAQAGWHLQQTMVPESLRKKFMYTFTDKTIVPATYVNRVFTMARRDKQFFQVSARADEMDIVSRVNMYRTKKRDKGLRMDVFDSKELERAGGKLKGWEDWYTEISQYELYKFDGKAADRVIADLTHQKVTYSEQLVGGTQIKLLLTFEDELESLYKPMRNTRAVETKPDHYYFSDFERHTAEIASYHLDRALGFRRTPPVAGRLLNITKDIEKYATPKFKKTMFKSPAGNKCFFGKCSYYCDTQHAVCGHPDWIEGSAAAFLPPSDVAPRKHIRSPWRRSYSKWRRADWEDDPDYCVGVMEKPPYNTGRRMLDVVDLAIFDYLSGNLDRHHYEMFYFPEEWGNDTAPVIIDNGRGFGKMYYDDRSILVPLYQCCIVRYTTVQKLLLYDEGPIPLSRVMKALLYQDSLFPILTDDHLTALDRRVKKILTEIQTCVEKKTWFDVVKDDGF